MIGFWPGFSPGLIHHGYALNPRKPRQYIKPSKDANSLSSEPVHFILLGKTAFTDVVKDLEMRKSSSVIQMDPKCHHSKRETEGD